MTLLAEKTYTPEDFLNDPSLTGFELVDGHLKERSMSKRSSAVAIRIASLLSNETTKTHEASVYGPDCGYRCFPDSETTLRFPDVSLVRTSSQTEESEDSGFMRIPADLVVEVLSPNDRIKDIDEKVAEYLKVGFGLVWVVNPNWRHVHVHRRDGSIQLLGEHDEITGETALPGFRCKVGEFFDV